MGVFKFPPVHDSENCNYLSLIKTACSVSIHVRRGDYLDDLNLGIFGDICSKEYFQKAVSKIYTIFDNPHFFVFSNDLQWCMENLKLSSVTYVSGNIGPSSWKDMYLMTNCSHNIISNSTFSWWGAWLNPNPDKVVICPTRFTRDDTGLSIYPAEWIRV